MHNEAADRDEDRPGATRRTTVRRIATVAILAALVVSGLALSSVNASRQNRAPYAAAAVQASVRMEMIAPGRAQAVADRLAGPGRLSAPVVEPVRGQPPRQQVVGQLTFRTPHNAPEGGQYALLIIDRALGKPVPAVYATGPVGTDVAQGWDGRYDKVAAKYPWLHMLASTPTPDGSGFTHPGMAVSFAPDTPGPVTFTAVLDPSSLPVTDPAQQLTVALAFIGENDHVHWATKLAG
jgi:hypothetical protein